MNPYPGRQSIMIMDNCSTHKSEAVRDAVEAAGLLIHRASNKFMTDSFLLGCLFIFLPPYSPDFSPIEESFSCGKCIRVKSY
jgi:transposase